MIAVEPEIVIAGATEPIPVGFVSFVMAVIREGHQIVVADDCVTITPPWQGNPGVVECLQDAPADVEACLVYLACEGRRCH